MKPSLLIISLLALFGITQKGFSCCQETTNDDCSSVHNISYCCSSPATTIPYCPTPGTLVTGHDRDHCSNNCLCGCINTNNQTDNQYSITPSKQILYSHPISAKSVLESAVSATVFLKRTYTGYSSEPHFFPLRM
ncbi:MAG: hypothetical protein JW795_02085 [Chitinivibrionales bacterium]|nr:hypothetical protein [Chitinivibrionales bacterium]